MPGDYNIDVTLACVDPALVSCWDRMVKQGKECSLLLKHSKGKVIATLQCPTPTTPSALPSSTSLSSSAKRKKKKKGGKKRKLEKLLAYHQRLVVEKGLPPSRLMEEHAAISSAPFDQSTGAKKFKCDQCEFTSDSQRGLKVHVGRSHKNPEVLRDEKHDQSLDLSFASSKREETSSLNADEAAEEQEEEEQREKEVSPFILALSKTLSLWPEDGEKHKCPSWREGRCRNLKCLLEVEKESREHDAAGYCDNCEENKNDCECDQDQE